MVCPEYPSCPFRIVQLTADALAPTQQALNLPCRLQETKQTRASLPRILQRETRCTATSQQPKAGFQPVICKYVSYNVVLFKGLQHASVGASNTCVPTVDLADREIKREECRHFEGSRKAKVPPHEMEGREVRISLDMLIRSVDFSRRPTADATPRLAYSIQHQLSQQL